jgi:hypothetical protein
MKKILIVLALTVASFANAQKGTVLVMGSVSYWSEKNSSLEANSKQTNFGFSPKVGYQFTDNWTVGGEAGISIHKYEYLANTNSGQESKTNNYSVGAFVRYSKSLSDLFLIYADLGAGYVDSKETNSNSYANPTTYTSKENGFYATIAPALQINIAKGFGLNFGFGGLNYSKKNGDNGINKNAFYFNFGQSFTAGISKNF